MNNDDIYSCLKFCAIKNIINCLRMSKQLLENSDAYLWQFLCKRDNSKWKNSVFIIKCNRTLFHYFYYLNPSSISKCLMLNRCSFKTNCMKLWNIVYERPVISWLNKYKICHNLYNTHAKMMLQLIDAEYHCKFEKYKKNKIMTD